MNSRLLLVVGITVVALLLLALGAGLLASRTSKPAFEVIELVVE